MLVCAVDLLGQLDKLEVRQLLHNLQQYVSSAAFAPTTELDIELLTELLINK